jgi:hypothetical protein
VCVEALSKNIPWPQWFNLPQSDQPRICYCRKEQDSNHQRIASLFLIPISHLVPLLEFNLLACRGRFRRFVEQLDLRATGFF